jgi:hypothetical protein
VHFYIGFPFDPTSSTACGYDKSRFLNSIINMIKFFDPAETLVASELRDKLSGENHTMETILAIINAISQPTFMEDFQFLQNSANKNDSRYIKVLEKRFLFSEVEIWKKEKEIQQIIKNNQELQKFYYQQIFINGEYNRERATQLLKVL